MCGLTIGGGGGMRMVGCVVVVELGVVVTRGVGDILDLGLMLTIGGGTCVVGHWWG